MRKIRLAEANSFIIFLFFLRVKKMSHGSKTHVLEESSAKYRHMYISLGYNTKFFFFPCLPTSSFPSPSCESLQIGTLLYISGN